MFKPFIVNSSAAHAFNKWSQSLAALLALSLTAQAQAQLAGEAAAPAAVATLSAPETAEADPQAQVADAGATEVAAAPATSLANDDEIEAVTVTARRVAENEQKVPIPIATLSGDALEADGSLRLESLNQKLPSTNIQYANPRQNSFSLRGFGNNPANDALETDVGIYLDNVYLARPGMANFDLIDIDQIFLLRGPQGTLFGKNTTAGVLNISTRQPSFTPQGAVEYSVGDRNYQQTRASFSGPLNDAKTLAGRLTLSQTRQDGFTKDKFDGRKLNGIDREGARGQLLYQHEDLSVRVIGDYQRENSACCVASIIFGPDGGAALNSHVVAAGGVPLGTPGSLTTTLNSPQSVYVRQGGLSAEVNDKLDGYQLTSITAYRSWYFRPTNDADFTSAPAITNAGQQVDDWQFSQELRVASPTGRNIEYVGGLYYFYQGQDNNLFTYYGPAADVFLGRPQGLLSNVFSNTSAKLVTNSASLFAQATWHVSERLNFTGGLRGTYEAKSTQVDRAAPVGGNAGTQAAFGPYHSGKLDRDDTNPSGLIGLDYALSDTVLAYASLAHGAKSGGINPAVPPLVNGAYDASLLSISPQRANDAELGIKSTLLDRRLLLNANLFWAQATDYQAASLVLDPATSTFRQIISNVGKVRSRGVETDLQYIPIKGINLSLAASYNDATFLDYKNGPCAAEITAADPSKKFCDLSGKDLPGAPRWIVNPSARIDHALTDKLQGYGIATYSWRSSYFAAPDLSTFSKVDGFGLANFRAGLQGSAGNAAWDLSAWVNNAFDTRYAQSGLGQSNYGSYILFAGAPRLYGATLRVNF